MSLLSVPPCEPPDLDEVVRRLDRIGEVWDRSTDEEKIRLAHSVFARAWVRAGKIIAVEPKPAMYPLLQVVQQAGMTATESTSGSDGIRTRGLGLDRAAC